MNPIKLEPNDRMLTTARAMAAGPVGEALVKHPLYYAKPVFFGGRPRRTETTTVSNGTITFLQLEKCVIGVTCAHVIQGFRDMQSNLGNALFQIGNVELNPLNQLIAEHQGFDLATISLSSSQLKRLLAQEGIGSRVIKPAQWPPQPVTEDNCVMLGGFPGALRELDNFDELSFGTFSAAGISVASSYDDYFTCQFERDYWVRSLRGNSKLPNHLQDLGGMSGGPVFVDRGHHFEFVGVIYEFSPAFDIMFCRPASLIQPDGSIGLER